ncbi:MAG: alpha/beta hydrolase, partial [Synergistaceae bacterium]|nr:alpha/beta hydrolase [Synergistaceae bacterium]
MKVEMKTAPGSFGDREVRLFFLSEKAEEQKPLYVLYHGVHGWAQPNESNKYGYLASGLARNGAVVCITENSRLRRDRETFGLDRTSWAHAAFAGKTFSMEIYDACSALAEAQKIYPERKAILWGFSLGGLIALMMSGGETGGFAKGFPLPAPAWKGPRGLVVSGSGDETAKPKTGTLPLPILDSLGEKSVLLRAASGAENLSFALFFYGSRDGTFTEESSRRLFRLIPIADDRKEFHIIPGADHSFRTVYD